MPDPIIKIDKSYVFQEPPAGGDRLYYPQVAVEYVDDVFSAMFVRQVSSSNGFCTTSLEEAKQIIEFVAEAGKLIADLERKSE